MVAHLWIGNDIKRGAVKHKDIEQDEYVSR